MPMNRFEIEEESPGSSQTAANDPYAEYRPHNKTLTGSSERQKTRKEQMDEEYEASIYRQYTEEREKRIQTGLTRNQKIDQKNNGLPTITIVDQAS